MPASRPPPAVYRRIGPVPESRDDLVDAPCLDCGEWMEQTREQNDDGIEPICDDCGAEIEAENQRLDWAEDRRKGDDW